MSNITNVYYVWWFSFVSAFRQFQKSVGYSAARYQMCGSMRTNIRTPIIYSHNSNNNSNNDKYYNAPVYFYGAVVMTIAIMRFHPVHPMKTSDGHRPSDQANRLGLCTAWCRE